MLKKEITYTDFNGEEQTEIFYFNLTQAEVAIMELGVEGGSLTEKIKKITRALDGKEIMGIFESIILDSYGERSPDGRKFIKSEEMREDFKQTAAYSALFMELAFDPEKLEQFINAIVPDVPDDKKIDLKERVKSANQELHAE